MQAIITRYLPCTNTLPARIRATCGRGSLTVSVPDNMHGHDEAHDYAAEKLRASFVAEDILQGSKISEISWSGAMVRGSFPHEHKDSFCFVFVPREHSPRDVIRALDIVSLQKFISPDLSAKLAAHLC